MGGGGQQAEGRGNYPHDFWDTKGQKPSQKGKEVLMASRDKNWHSDPERERKTSTPDPLTDTKQH